MRFHVSVAQKLFLIKENLFFLKCDQVIYTFEETQNSHRDVIGDIFCPTCPSVFTNQPKKI